MKKKFSDQQLSHIIDQALIYQCACPAQVAKHLIGMRDLHEYQKSCVNLTQTDKAVHECIAIEAERAHEVLEECLYAVLMLEQWDMDTLVMPKSLQKPMRNF